MKKELEIEAEKYVKSLFNNDLLHANTYDNYYDFITGATSKYVERQKLQFAIELLNELEFNPKEHIVDFVLHIKNKIKELEEQLKEYEAN